ncbi:MAG: hypothetical protein R3E73_12870 [Porticoccaceae bacterium]
MNNWLTFLNNLDATLAEDNSVSFGETIADYANLRESTRLVPLANMGVLKVSAERANEFLQGQMTCDFRELSNTRSLPGAQCNPKGRMLNTFRALQLAEQQILLTMSADLVASTHSTLNKFAPFSKHNWKTHRRRTHSSGSAARKPINYLLPASRICPLKAMT